jgi:hypothetical protein
VTPAAARVAAAGLAVVLLAAWMPAPSAARILKTRRPGEYHELELVLGSGFEYETDGEESEYGFPFLAEYGFTKMLKLSVEPSVIWIRKKNGGRVTGPGDLETTLSCEFPTERRWRPGFALEGTVKWPTAKKGDLGTGKSDYTIGALISKEFVQFDLELSSSYTFIGSPAGIHLENTLEHSVAAEWHLNPRLDLEAEAVLASGAGRFRNPAGTLGSFANIGGPEQGQSEAEFTLGFAEFLTRRLKLEEGGILKNDGSWQTVIGWEYDFGEGR